MRWRSPRSCAGFGARRRGGTGRAFDGPVVSKSTVGRICTDTRERYRAWCGRRLDEHDLVYPFLDAIYLRLRPDDEPAEGVLVAWGVTLEGRKVLFGLQLGSRESYEDWLDFGRDLLARGARPPALIVADGAPSLWKAARELWPAALEQRCTVHALRNVTKKLPERLHRELKARYWRILDEATSVAGARAALQALAADYRASYPRRRRGSSATSTRSSATCASQASTASGSAPPTCSSAPSSRCDGARK